MTTLDLKKGETLILSKEVSIDNLVFAGGWDQADAGQKDVDVDLVVVFLGANGKPLVADGNLDTLNELKQTAVYFGKKKSDCGSIVHGGDNLTGKGDGDDESIKVNLATLPSNIEGLILIATIFDATAKGQDFTKVKNEYVRILDVANNKEIKFTTDFGAEETFEAVRVTRSPEGWVLNAIGAAVDGELIKYINGLLAA